MPASGARSTATANERRWAAPRRELLPLGGQRRGGSRKRGGTPVSAPIPDDVLARLVAVLDRHERLAIAVSGGVDSMTLAHVAWRHSRVRTTMYHATGPAVPAAARTRVETHAKRHGWPLVLLDAGEQDDARYRANPVDRCYYCKSNLYARIRDMTTDAIASGTNRDDLSDFRPGLRAAAEQAVVHPYVEAAIAKADVYALAQRLHLDDLERLPAQPCLASRVETGIAIAAADLAFIDRVEAELSAQLGPATVVRCRVTHAGVAIELAGSAGRNRIGDCAGRGRTRVSRGRTGVRGNSTLRARRGISARCRARRRPLGETGRPMTDFRMDWERTARTGASEAVLCEPKSAAQIEGILAHAATLGKRLLLTRLEERKFGQLAASVRDTLDYDAISRTAIRGVVPAPRGTGRIAIVSGGTSDVPVAREAVRTLAFEGEAATEFVDVGVAGLWRLMERLDEIRGHRVVIAIAGMEGALFSVLAGLVPCPVLAVPSSVGYGVGAGGRTALRAALASCAPGLAVVNIDNGFGAAHAALRMLGASLET